MLQLNAKLGINGWIWQSPNRKRIVKRNANLKAQIHCKRRRRRLDTSGWCVMPHIRRHSPNVTSISSHTRGQTSRVIAASTRCDAGLLAISYLWRVTRQATHAVYLSLDIGKAVQCKYRDVKSRLTSKINWGGPLYQIRCNECWKLGDLTPDKNIKKNHKFSTIAAFSSECLPLHICSSATSKCRYVIYLKL